MRNIFYLTSLYLLASLLSLFQPLSAQTYTWVGYPSGGLSYTNGILTTTITNTAAPKQYGSPKYYATATVGSGQCGLAGGLAIEEMFSNITTAQTRIVFDFTSGGTTSGTCASITFTVFDVNSDENLQTFKDKLDISGIDGNNVAISPVVTKCASNTLTGTTTKTLTGFGPGMCTCQSNTISLTPPANTPLKSITLVYYPDRSGTYWNFSGPLRPAYQYIVISPLQATVTGCPLPIELLSFTGKPVNETNEIKWTIAQTAQFENFIVERGANASEFQTIGNITKGGQSSFTFQDEHPIAGKNYYRLKAMGTDGSFNFSQTIEIENNPYQIQIEAFPNPTQRHLNLQISGSQPSAKLEIMDVFGKIVYTEIVKESGIRNLDVSNWSKGIYILTAHSIETNERLVQSKITVE